MHPHLMDTIGRLDKVCPWLHVPVQSGSDRVLRRMKRLYTSGNTWTWWTMPAGSFPTSPSPPTSSSGFPGETEADFQDTLEVVRRVKYDQIFSFKYSERPGVPAAKLADDVPLEEKKRRLGRLMAVQEEIWNAEADRQVGQIWTAVVEGTPRAGRPEPGACAPANNRKVVLHGVSLRGRAAGHASGSPVARNTTFLGELLDLTLSRPGREERGTTVWVFKGLLFLVLLFALVYFFVTNSDQSVDINFFGKSFLGISIYWVVVVSFLLGFATSFILAALREFRFHREIGSLKRAARGQGPGNRRPAHPAAADHDRQSRPQPQPGEDAGE